MLSTCHSSSSINATAGLNKFGPQGVKFPLRKVFDINIWKRSLFLQCIVADSGFENLNRIGCDQ